MGDLFSKSTKTMKTKIKWGVLGAAKIAVQKVIPAMQQGAWCEITAIASRELPRAQQAAQQLHIPKAYGSYEELLADPDIDAIYNPLPNHLHIPWTMQAMEAGKHVLCEKPLVLSAEEILPLIELRDRTQLKVGEAFMVKTHPQWLKVREMVQAGELGELIAIQGCFSYTNRDPKNVRNIAEYGGGGIYDIGCYPVTISRFVTGEEPVSVCAYADIDPVFNTDRLASAILQFPSLHSSFVCSTQMVKYQTMHFYGTKKHLEVLIPFNAPPDRPCIIRVDEGDLFRQEVTEIEFPICDQYQLQGDAFSQAILNDTEVPVPLEDALGNAKVLDAIFESVKTKKAVSI